MADLVRIILVVEVACLDGRHATHLKLHHVLLLLALQPLLLRKLRLALERSRISHELLDDFLTARAHVLHVADLVSGQLLDGLTIVHDVTIISGDNEVIHVAHNVVFLDVEWHALHAIQLLSLALIFFSVLLFFLVVAIITFSVLSNHEKEVAHELSLVRDLLQLALARVHK